MAVLLLIVQENDRWRIYEKSKRGGLLASCGKTEIPIYYFTAAVAAYPYQKNTFSFINNEELLTFSASVQHVIPSASLRAPRLARRGSEREGATNYQ